MSVSNPKGSTPTRNRVFRKNSVSLAHLLVLGGYLLATLLFTWPLATNLTTAIPGDSFDGWQNYWNQWWIKQALIDRLVWPLHTDILYAPTGVNLYFQTLNPFNGLATLPIQLTGGLIAAYNAVVFLSWVLGGYGMFLLARWVIGQRRTGSRTCRDLQLPGTLAAFVAGLVYTLSPFHMAHLLGHMQVMSLEWLPFYILYLLRAIQPEPKPAMPLPVSPPVLAAPGSALRCSPASSWSLTGCAIGISCFTYSCLPGWRSPGSGVREYGAAAPSAEPAIPALRLFYVCYGRQSGRPSSRRRSFSYC